MNSRNRKQPLTRKLIDPEIIAYVLKCKADGDNAEVIAKKSRLPEIVVVSIIRAKEQTVVDSDERVD